MNDALTKPSDTGPSPVEVERRRAIAVARTILQVKGIEGERDVDLAILARQFLRSLGLSEKG